MAKSIRMVPRETVAMAFEIVALDHVQLAMPRGKEAEAEAFYAGLLGFERIPKPPALAVRGGCWFKRGPVQIHLGVEDDFRPAKKAHPALVVSNFDHLCAQLQDTSHPVKPDHELPGVQRGYVDDPFGNRIELIGRAEG